MRLSTTALPVSFLSNPFSLITQPPTLLAALHKAKLITTKTASLKGL